MLTTNPTSRFLLTLSAVVCSLVVACDVQSQESEDVATELSKVELKKSDLENWRRHILPDESELAWKQIPWLPTFQEGILQGAKESKPVLLWTMNGHPLGCT